MITYMGYIALYFTIYNIGSGILVRLVTRNKSPNDRGTEAAIWFVAAAICLK